ncbi:toxin-antitoxin system YwqK family antitoxin (plasmid) [Massilia varians]
MKPMRKFLILASLLAVSASSHAQIDVCQTAYFKNRQAECERYKAAGRALNAKQKPKEGEEKVYDIYNRNLVAVRHWKNGREHGVQNFYNRDDGKTLTRQYHAVNGVRAGAEKAWTAQGELVGHVEWKDGKPSGYMLTDLNDNFTNSKIVGYKIVQFKDGLKDGPVKTFSDGRLRKIEHFAHEQLHGLTQLFNARGEVYYELMYKAGELVVDDSTTARHLELCRDAWLAEYKESGLYKSANADEREYKLNTDFPSRCKKGILPASLGR